MKKIRLDLDDLQIQTFDPQPESVGTEQGTVFGFQELGSDVPSCDSCGCPEPSAETCGEWTCLLSCAAC